MINHHSVCRLCSNCLYIYKYIRYHQINIHAWNMMKTENEPYWHVFRNRVFDSLIIELRCHPALRACGWNPAPVQGKLRDLSQGHNVKETRLWSVQGHRTLHQRKGEAKKKTSANFQSETGGSSSELNDMQTTQRFLIQWAPRKACGWNCGNCGNGAGRTAGARGRDCSWRCNERMGKTHEISISMWHISGSK